MLLFSVQGNNTQGGNIQIKSPVIELEYSRLVQGTDTVNNPIGETRAGTIHVEASDQLIMTGGIISLNADVSFGSSYHPILPGMITVTTPKLRMNENSSISTNTTRPSGSNGITIRSSLNSDLSLHIVGDGTAYIGGTAESSGSSGTIKVAGKDITIQGVEILSQSRPNPYYGNGQGNAGIVAIEASGNVKLGPGTRVNTNTYGNGNAGVIKVTGKSILLDNSFITSETQTTNSLGSAGDISFISTGFLSLINNSAISSNTVNQGKAGAINIAADNLLLNQSKISSEALEKSTGKPGNIEINSKNSIRLTNNSLISVINNSSAANHGHNDQSIITITSPNIYIDGHSQVTSATASAFNASSIYITSPNHFSSLTIQGDGTGIIDSSSSGSGRAGDINVIANGDMTLDSINISSNTSGLGNNYSRIASSPITNMNAGNIRINAWNSLTLQNAHITTTANDANGGNITIDGGHIMRLIDAAISTSVSGNKGNGGNIDVTADILFLKHGFIQANTLANNAFGGSVVINANALIASNGSLFLGGNIPILFSSNQSNLNVIQSAAPEGSPGSIELVSAPMDGSSLANLELQTIDTAPFSQDICRIGAGSSLTRMSRTNTLFSSTQLRQLRVNTKLSNTSLASNQEM